MLEIYDLKSIDSLRRLGDQRKLNKDLNFIMELLGQDHMLF
jgi:hypothetical protein